MNEYLLEPLKGYETYFKDTHDSNLKEYFNSLLEKSQVNEEQNRQTAAEYRKALADAQAVAKKIKKYKALRVLLIVCAVIGGILCLGAILNPFLLIAGIPLIAVSIILIIKKLKPLIKSAGEEYDKLNARANELLSEAEAQMAPLNALFDSTDTYRVIEKTLPEMKFHSAFTQPAEDNFIENFGRTDIIDSEMTVTDVVSGELYANPFAYTRAVRHVMGTQPYVGTLVIRWTETYRDSKGHTRTRTRTQTLTATVVKPKPFYHEETYLGYGSQSAPRLNFSRSAAHNERLSEKELEKKLKRGERELKKMSEDAIKDGKSFQEMANSEFEVLFDADNRDNEMEFRLMFTPLAQKNTVSLLRSHVGYGDDFDFIKRGRFNVIKSEHSQSWCMDTSPQRYMSYDVDISRESFISFNNEYFKSVYFDFAPLMAVPAYQEESVHSLSVDAIENYSCKYSLEEYESLANMLGQRHFEHPESRTRAILKASHISNSNGVNRVQITAYSYTTVERIDFVPVLGGDGKIHPVPVPWTEYIPVQNCADMAVGYIGASDCDFHRTAESVQLPSGAYRHGLFACPVDAQASDGIYRTFESLRQKNQF